MIAAAITGGDVTVDKIIPKHMDSLSAKLTEMGCKIVENDDSIRVVGATELQGCRVKTMVYPGYPTDLHPQMTALLSTACGTSVLTEAVFEHRFQYIKELLRLGASVKVEGRVAIIEGGSTLSGAQVTATDLRAGAALIVAGLAAEGQTVIGNVKYLDRGYERFEEKLTALGAEVGRVHVEE